MAAGRDPIKHVVLLILENHSFDQMLGCMREVYPDLDGIDPTHLHSNADNRGNEYFQRVTNETQMRYDPKHEHVNVLQQLKNSNSNFVLDFSQAHPLSKSRDRQEIMGYYKRGFLPALHTLAQEFVICDRWFSSLPGPTWPNRFFALSGTSHGVVIMPEGIHHIHPSSFLEQVQPTIFDRLNEADRKWHVYHYDLPASWILLRQLEPQNLLWYHHMDSFFSHAKSGELPDFTFIEPKYSGQDQNDDHPPHNTMKAEKLIADVYNAIRSNQELWESTLLVVFYDEHGGFYDHVTPPPAVPPDEHVKHYSFDQFGVRVPAILVSPWLSPRVDHTVFDHTSLLRYLSDKWSLGPLGERTAHANSIKYALKFSDTPQTATTPFIRVPNSALYASRPELEPFDRSTHHRALALFAQHLEAKFDISKVSSTDDSARHGWSTSLRRIIGRKLMGWGYQLSAANRSVELRMTALAERIKSNVH